MMREKTIIGRVEPVKFPELAEQEYLARIDTGATYSTIWASARETNQGLEVSFFDGKYTKTFSEFFRRGVRNSTGEIQSRYVIKTIISLKGRRVRAKLTLSDRSNQMYPVLIGRNILRNKFIVDVAQGQADLKLEKAHRAKIEQLSRRLEK